MRFSQWILATAALLFATLAGAEFDACEFAANSWPEARANVEATQDQFKIDRPFDTYAKGLFREDGEEFFANLLEGEIWMDIGANTARAIDEGVRKYPHLKGIALDFLSNFSGSARVNPKLTLISGEFIEILFAKGLLNAYLGKLRYVSDYVGAAAYSPDLRKTVHVIASLLKPGGEASFRILAERNLLWTAEGKEFPNQFLREDGTQISVEQAMHEFIARSKGIEPVEIWGNAVQGTYTVEKYVVVRIRRTEASLEIGELTPVSFVEDIPPKRVFRVP